MAQGLVMDRKKPVNGTVGARLMQVREARGMSRRELAQQLGITQRMLRYYERGAVRVTVERLGEFAAALRCRPIDLLVPVAVLPTTRGTIEADHSQ